MSPAILNAIKRPLLIGVGSGVCFTVVALMWVKSPVLIPLGLLITVGTAGGITFLVCETIVVLRVAKMVARSRLLAVEIRNPPLRSLVALGVTLVLSNALLFHVTDLRPRPVWAAAVSIVLVVSWASARWVARRRQRRTAK